MLNSDLIFKYLEINKNKKRKKKKKIEFFKPEKIACTMEIEFISNKHVKTFKKNLIELILFFSSFSKHIATHTKFEILFKN